MNNLADKLLKKGELNIKVAFSEWKQYKDAII